MIEELKKDSIISFLSFLGYLGGILSAAYLVAKKINQKSRFTFQSYSTSSKIEKKDGNERLIISYDGILMNESTEANSITEVSYTVWDEKSKYKSLSNGLILGKYKDIQNDSLKELPIYFLPKESKRVVFTAEVQITGTHNKEIISATKSIAPNSPFTIPKYTYEIGFRDVKKNFFDKDGKIRSQKIMDLWWTLPNTFHALKKGNPLPYITHMLRILHAWVVFKISKMKHFFGF